VSETEQPVQHDEYDGPWKEILEHYLELFFAFFFPHIHAQIDWEKGYVFLDKELDSMTRDAEIGKRVADKLVQVWTKSGTPVKVFIHIEVQNQKDTTFDERMFVYNYRIFDDKRENVVSLAVLGDEHANWRPDRYHRGMWGCEVSFTFPIVKLLDYRKDWDALERASQHNPFALIVMAHLKVQETRGNALERKQWKMNIMRRLYESGYSREDINTLFRVIDWLMKLPEKLEAAFWQELQQYEEEGRI